MLAAIGGCGRHLLVEKKKEEGAGVRGRISLWATGEGGPHCEAEKHRVDGEGALGHGGRKSCHCQLDRVILVRLEDRGSGSMVEGRVVY